MLIGAHSILEAWRALQLQVREAPTTIGRSETPGSFSDNE